MKDHFLKHKNIWIMVIALVVGLCFKAYLHYKASN